MKIALYSEPSQGALGGAELSVAILANALAADHDVRLLHHRPEMTAAALGAFASVDLSRVETVYAPPSPADAWSCSATSNPLARFRQARAWQAELSRGSDLFINFTHGVPPFCHARAGILIVLFPLFRRPEMWPWADAGATSGWKRNGRRAYYDWEWTQRLETYDAKLSISAFSQAWTERWWGAPTSVVHPPVDTRFPVGPKRDLILSVGRFATAGLNKRHREMVDLFRRLHESDIPDWTYLCAGALGSSAADREYFAGIRRAASPGCDVQANVPRDELKRLYGEARIFWHGAGFGDREEISPEMSEHFGMATVEAMAAGCVPVVFDSGGQREIVTHGVDGFLWRTLDDLRRLTTGLARDEGLCHRMAAAARLRAGAFSADIFIHRINGIVESVLSDRRRPTKTQGMTAMSPLHTD